MLLGREQDFCSCTHINNSSQCACICMYVCMQVRTYLCTQVCMYACMHPCTHVRMDPKYVCRSVVCLCVYLFVFMYACMYALKRCLHLSYKIVSARCVHYTCLLRRMQSYVEVAGSPELIPHSLLRILLRSKSRRRRSGKDSALGLAVRCSALAPAFLCNELAGSTEPEVS